MKTFISILLLSGLILPAHAASSPWFETEGAKIRLISLPSPNGKTIDAGLQIQLEKGWKTYWRAPGASGLPPQFSFSGSTNLASAKVHYPVPSTFGDAENLTAGYLSSVTFPVKVEPLFANRPLSLLVNGVVGICADICVPVQFQLSLTEDGKGGTDRDVAASLFQARLAMVEQETDDFSINEVVLDGTLLKVSARVPDGSQASTLMIEGPDDWYLTPVKASRLEDGVASFTVDLKDIPKSAKPAETLLRFTLVTSGRGVEKTITPKRR